jgi:hypothetical protein
MGDWSLGILLGGFFKTVSSLPQEFYFVISIISSTNFSPSYQYRANKTLLAHARTHAL